jgi:hypothetical protein
MIVNPNKHEAIIFGKTNHVFSFAVKESIELFGLVPCAAFFAVVPDQILKCI